jgi:hypothetical protein
MASGWERLAAFEGGTVGGLAVATTVDGGARVFAATPVGVFHSVDGGQRWHPLGEASAVAGAEVVAPSPRFADDRTVFIGARGGLYRWREGGPGWEHLLSGSRVLGLAVLPGDGAELVLLAGTEDDGVLISRDGGRGWAGANPGLLDLTILALAASPSFGQDGLAFAATPSGLYRTRNAAESWRAVELDLDRDGVAVQCLAISPAFAQDRLVLAGTEEHGLLRSDDAGRSWSAAPELAERSVNGVACFTGGRVVAATDAGLALSADGGRSWRLVGRDLGPALSVALLLGAAWGEGVHVLLAGLPDRGVARSADEGRTWSAANAGLTASLLVGLALAPSFEQDQTVFAASLQRGVSVSTDGGRTWTERSDGLADTTVYQVAAWRSPAGDQVVFAATAAGLYASRDGGLSWRPALSDQAATPPRALALAPAGSSAATLLVASPGGRLITSADGGSSWATLETTFGQAEVVALAVSPAYERDGTIFAATAGPPRQDGSGELVVWRSTSHGRRWQRWLAERGAGPVQLAALPAAGEGNDVVVGLGGRVLRPRLRSWEVIGGARRPVWDAVELPGRPAAVTGLAASPGYRQDRSLFAGTSAGVYVSRDGGASFAAWSDGLEPPATVAVALSPAYVSDRLVYALGLGGTIWRRRDGEPTLTGRS